METFVLISTDKAVRPTSVMGATKRFAELILQAFSKEKGTSTRFINVRFGNVLGSSGSVVPLFQQQIAEGGPVTVTHSKVLRYFMTIPEAAQLVIHAGDMGQGGEVFMLDMGEPVLISELAKNMIHLSGLSVRDENNPDGDIEIVYTGLQDGEKLYEALLSREEMVEAEDLGGYYRIPPDLRDLNYNKFVEEGEERISQAEDYNSHNTHRLDVEGMADLLRKLDFMREIEAGNLA